MACGNCALSHQAVSPMSVPCDIDEALVLVGCAFGFWGHLEVTLVIFIFSVSILLLEGEYLLSCLLSIPICLLLILSLLRHFSIYVIYFASCACCFVLVVRSCWLGSVSVVGLLCAKEAHNIQNLVIKMVCTLS